MAIVERQYLAKLESVRSQLPKLRQIVVIDAEADPGIGDGTGAEHGRETVAGVISWSRLLDLGRRRGGGRARPVRGDLAAGEPRTTWPR